MPSPGLRDSTLDPLRRPLSRTGVNYQAGPGRPSSRLQIRALLAEYTYFTFTCSSASSTRFASQREQSLLAHFVLSTVHCVQSAMCLRLTWRRRRMIPPASSMQLSQEMRRRGTERREIRRNGSHFASPMEQPICISFPSSSLPPVSVLMSSSGLTQSVCLSVCLAMLFATQRHCAAREIEKG